MPFKFVRWLIVLTVAACPAVAALEIWSAAPPVRTEDHNGDGRPDVWRRYDARGRLVEVDVDSNFDGRPDVQEYYDRGALVRRQSDRNFNGQTDFIEEFDFDTHARTRSVIDIDYDGTADLLVLFRAGRPVYQEWAHPITPAGASGSSTMTADVSRTADDQLTPFEDPFRMELALRAVPIATGSGDCVGLSTSGGFPASSTAVICPCPSASDASDISVSHPSSAAVIPHSPRGPPVVSPLRT